jgi:hypothetical protein
VQLVEPVLDWYFPAAQRVQSVAVDAEYWPCRQL